MNNVILFLILWLAYFTLVELWFRKKSVEYKKTKHKKITIINYFVVFSAYLVLFPSVKNPILVPLAGLLLCWLHFRSIFFCESCGKLHRQNMFLSKRVLCSSCEKDS